jgi:hypothetical protein
LKMFEDDLGMMEEAEEEAEPGPLGQSSSELFQTTCMAFGCSPRIGHHVIGKHKISLYSRSLSSASVVGSHCVITM